MEENLNLQVCMTIKQLRVDQKMTLEEFSQFSGLPVNQLREIEAGTAILYLSDLNIVKSSLAKKGFKVTLELVKE